MLYVGTGCIYSDTSERVFSEEDPPNFHGSAYSRVKALTDAVLAQHLHVLTARIRMPVGDEANPRDFVSKLLSYPVVCQEGANSLTILRDVLPALLALAHAGHHGGLYNAVNPGPMTHGEVLAVFRDVADICHEHRVVTDPAELRLRAARSCCRLSAEKLQTALATTAPEVRRLYGAPAKLPDAATSLAAVALDRRGGPRNLLVTGGCGFIGSAFVNDWLHNFSSDTVVNVDCLAEDSGSRRGNVDADDPKVPSHARYLFVKLDLADEGAEAALLALMRSRKVDTVVHFAARTHVDHSFDGDMSLEYTRSNVLGTHRMLEATRRYMDAAPGALRTFFHMSTDEVCGEILDDEGAREETTVLRPTNPYAGSKAGAEHMVGAYMKSHGVPCVICRCNNVFGPRQFTTKVIPRFSTMALRGETLPLHGGGRAVRSFVHVDDVVRAVALLIGSGRPGSVVNVGADFEISIADLARRICELAGRGSVEDTPDRLFQDRRYSMNDARLRAMGWRPLVPFDEGLERTFRWYAEHAASFSAQQTRASSAPSLLSVSPSSSSLSQASSTG
jgi:dTDP-glucose 4,6-dehydratase